MALSPSDALRADITHWVKDPSRWALLQVGFLDTQTPWGLSALSNPPEKEAAATAYLQEKNHRQACLIEAMIQALNTVEKNEQTTQFTNLKNAIQTHAVTQAQQSMLAVPLTGDDLDIDWRKQLFTRLFPDISQSNHDFRADHDSFLEKFPLYKKKRSTLANLIRSKKDSFQEGLIGSILSVGLLIILAGMIAVSLMGTPISGALFAIIAAPLVLAVIITILAFRKHSQRTLEVPAYQTTVETKFGNELKAHFKDAPAPAIAPEPASPLPRRANTVQLTTATTPTPEATLCRSKSAPQLTTFWKKQENGTTAAQSTVDFVSQTASLTTGP
ncbi:MAG: hypothetical protein HY939_02180 [Gammaproteobacteria bacterium]|nr:hypothetical protein [Gammaproteobacteria bacterium]